VDFPELLLIRHAESEWNACGRWQGHADPPLSERGRRQAEALARELAAEPIGQIGRIDRIESSDLLRARETAAPLAAALGMPVRTDPLYRELDLGVWSGLTGDEIRARGDEVYERFTSRQPDARAPEGESRLELWARARASIEALCEGCAGERVVLVTHSGFVRACFPDLQAQNASVHRSRADLLLERLERGLAIGASA